MLNDKYSKVKRYPQRQFNVRNVCFIDKNIS